VKQAITDLNEVGVKCVQVTFEDHLEQFYKQCGFFIFKGGIVDFKHMKWDGE
jgi:hypothetical protein